jgi:hypothetical protein
VGTNELVLTSGNTAMLAYGDREVLDLLANRIAMFFAIGEDLTGAAKENELKVARPALLKAAQMTYQLGVIPGTDVFVIKRGKKYSAEPSLEMWKKMADRHAYLGKFRYTVDVEDLTPDQVKLLTDPDQIYDPEDRGAVARLFRHDKASELKGLGIPYRPRPQYGFWRKHAVEKEVWENNQRTGKKEWKPDQVPAQRSRQDVAARRATRAAIMAEFNMIPLDDFRDRYQSEERAGEVRAAAALRFLEAEMAEDRRKAEDQGTTPEVSQGGYYMDDDGNVWATDKRPVTLKSAPVMAAGQVDNADGWGDWVLEDEFDVAYDWATKRAAASDELDATWDALHEYAHDEGLTPSEFLARWRDLVNGLTDKVQKGAADVANVEHNVGYNGSGGGADKGTHVGNERSVSPAPAATTPNTGRPNWRSPVDAQNWAVKQGTAKNGPEAMNSWKNTVKAVFPDNTQGISPADLPAVFDAFYAKHVEKATKQAV